MSDGSLVVFYKGFITVGTVGPGMVPVQNRGLKNRIRYAGLSLIYSDLEDLIHNCKPK